MSDVDIDQKLFQIENLDSTRNSTYNPIMIEFVIHGIMLSSVAIAGLFSNIICLFTLRRPCLRRRQGTVNIILASMAAVDMVMVLTAFLMCGLPGLAMFSLLDVEGRKPSINFKYLFLEAIETMLPYITPIVYPIGLMAQTASVYLTVFVTIERFIVVCHPLKAKIICTTTKTRLGVFLFVSFSVLYNIPRFFEYTYFSLEIPSELYQDEAFFGPGQKSNATKSSSRVSMALQITPLRQNPLYVAIYINWMYFFIMFIIPFVILLSLNWKIMKAIKKAIKNRTEMINAGSHQCEMRNLSTRPSRATLESFRERVAREKEEKEQQKLSIMLMVVVLVFMFLNFFAMIINLLETFDVQMNTLTLISNFLVTLNSSVNLVIYCAFGRKFRRELKAIIFCSK